MRYPALKIAVLLLLAPQPTQGQVVRGQLLNGESNLPLEGAIMVLQGAGGEVGSVLSNATGRFLLRAPGPGSFTVRADRIGHASTTYPSFHLSVGDTLDIQMVAEVSAIQLEGIQISGERRCVVRPEAGRAVATVWEEARKALAATALTEESGTYQYRTVRSTKELDKGGRRVISEQRRSSQQFQKTPFESLPAEVLITEGFVRPDPDGDLYFAPDATVLLSDDFLDSHCFQLTSGRGESEGLLGVGFEPIGGRTQPDIRGVMWVQPETGYLRHLEYTYENIDPALRNDKVGGDVVFQGLPNGSWIVTEWRIRMPVAALAPDFTGGRQLVLAGIHEAGGEVDRVRDQAGNTILQAERASLSGVILDQSGREPLSGATVSVLGTAATATTDSLGSFTLAGLSEGLYGVSFSHASAPALGGFPEPVEVELVAGEMASIRMIAPPLSSVLEAACGEADRPRGSSVLTGIVTDGETGQVIPGATVRVSWTDFGPAGGGRISDLENLLKTREDGLEGSTDEMGRFLACAVPYDHPLTVEAEWSGITSGALALQLPLEAPFFEQDVTISHAGTGDFSGLAVAWEDQGPLEGVRVFVEGPDQESSSDADGRFLIEKLPLGRHVLRAEMLGRRTVTDTIQIRPDRHLQMEIRLPTEALEIDGITVEVLSMSDREVRMAGRAGATLDRITPEEMDVLREKVTGIVDVIRTMGSPRIRITEYGPQGFPLGFCMRWNRGRPPSITGAAVPENVEGLSQGISGGCQSMLLVVDGQPLFGGPIMPPSAFVLDMTPGDIESVEVLSPVQAQFRYGQEGSNGALVIQTRKGGVEEGLNVPGTS